MLLLLFNVNDLMSNLISLCINQILGQCGEQSSSFNDGKINKKTNGELNKNLYLTHRVSQPRHILLAICSFSEHSLKKFCLQ